MAEIVVRRLSGHRVDRRRAYGIFIDGKKCDTIQPGETKRIEARPGPHELQLKIDWGSSEKLHINLGEGEDVTFVCKPRITQNSVNLKVGAQGLYWATFGRKRYIQLSPNNREAPHADLREHSSPEEKNGD